MTERERQIRQRLKDDFRHYAPRCLHIKPKNGGLVPLALNDAQLLAHERIEAQLRERGMARALLLKGRQQGLSTYTEGRYYWKVSHRKGVSAYILTHEARATANLFRMSKRYHQHCPDLVRPTTSYSNATELVFDQLDSRYTVGTAGSKDTGRSDTVQYFHGSEVAMWPHAEDHVAGVMQAIPRGEGTEVILESTAKGQGNYWHTQWKKAESGESDFIPVFIPWYLQSEYAEELPEGFTLTAEEQEYSRLYPVTPKQLMWRRLKVTELGLWRFRQEYPFTPVEAFQSSNEFPYITAEVAFGALGRRVEDSGQVVLGIDPARKGKDRFVVQVRKGPRLLDTVLIPYRVKADSMAAVGLILKIAEQHRVKLAGIDGVGLGGPIADRLREVAPGLRVIQVNAGTNNALDRGRFSNIQTEMYSDMREWLAEASIPRESEHAQALIADICAPSFDYDSHGRDRLESKDSMAKRNLRSPDLADALAISIIAERMAKAGTARVTVIR